MSGISTAFKNLLREFLYRIPSENLKNEILKWMHRTQGRHPRELIINGGDSAVIVGTSNALRVHQFAKLTGDEGRVLFIEPEPQNFSTLKKAAEDFSYVSVDKRGAWSSSGKQELLLGDESHPGDHKVPVEAVEHDNDYREENYNGSIKITVDTLDTILSEHDIKPDYIELMVNGAEFEILKGANNILSNPETKLLIKGHQKDIKTGEPLNRQISKYLQNYEFKTIIGAGGTPTVGETDGWEKRDGDVYAYK